MNMKSTTFVTGFILGLSALGASAEENHLQQAVEHTMMAAKATDGKTVAQHALEAQKHAKTADEHLDQGVKSLQSAIEYGNQNKGDLAQKAAQEAAQHLTAAQ